MQYSWKWLKVWWVIGNVALKTTKMEIKRNTSKMGKCAKHSSLYKQVFKLKTKCWENSNTLKGIVFPISTLWWPLRKLGICLIICMLQKQNMMDRLSPHTSTAPFLFISLFVELDAKTKAIWCHPSGHALIFAQGSREQVASILLPNWPDASQAQCVCFAPFACTLALQWGIRYWSLLEAWDQNRKQPDTVLKTKAPSLKYMHSRAQLWKLANIQQPSLFVRDSQSLT